LPAPDAAPRAALPEAPGSAPRPASADELYREAEEHLAGGRLPAALALLSRLSEDFPDDPLAAAAHYERGVALRERLRDASGAAAAFRAYLELAPSGPLWREARVALCRLAPEPEAVACFRSLAEAAGASWAAREARLGLAQ